MKKTLFILILITIGFPVFAYPFWSAPTPNVTVFTNSTILTFTNSQTVTNIQGSKESIQHTLDIFGSMTGTNAVIANLDSTIDGANWIPQSTNTISTNGFSEVKLTGKWAQFRWRLTALTTNGTVIENYMAQ
jgi:hypothetical protein